MVHLRRLKTSKFRHPIISLRCRAGELSLNHEGRKYGSSLSMLFDPVAGTARKLDPADTRREDGKLSRVKNKVQVTVYLTPEEHGILANLARRYRIDNSEAAAIGIQLLRETHPDDIKRRLTRDEKGRRTPIREYDPETGRVILLDKHEVATKY